MKPMDEATHEAIDEVLGRALDRINQVVQLLPDQPEVVHELNVAQRLIEAAMHAAQAEASPDSLDGDAPYRAIHPDDLLPMPPLTMREEEVLNLMAQGLRNKEIAARLGIA